MIEAREGYDEGAAQAYLDAHTAHPLFEETKPNFERLLEKVRKSGLFFGLYSDGEPVGAALFYDSQAHVGVLPQVRGGKAHAVMRDILSKALERNDCYLAQIHASDVASQLLAEKMGFLPVQVKAPCWTIYFVRRQ